MRKIVDFTEIFKKHKGKWVALKQDEQTVVTASKSAKRAYKEALAKGEKRPILLKVPTQSTYYVGSYH